VTAQHGADGDADLVGPVQRRPLALDPFLDGIEIALGCRKQVIAPARSFGGQVGVAADAIRRSPGKSGEVMTAMLRSSNSVSCNRPPSAKALISGARSAVIQSRLAGITSSRMRAWVIMPLSPTSTTRARLKRPFSLSI